MTPLISRFEEALLSLNRLAAKETFMEVKYALTPIQFVEQVIVPALERIGAGWEQGRLALSQVYMSGRICEDLVDGLLPPGAPERKHQPRMGIVVLEDYHVLGKRIVYAMLRASGFEVFDYGRMTMTEVVNRTLADRIEVLLISTLMLPSALQVKQVRTHLDRAGASVKIVVGGAPFLFDPALWQSVGADVMGRTASEAVAIVSHLC